MDLGVRIRTHWQCRNPLHDAARTALEPPSQVHAHMIRHATGDKLADAGKDTRSTGTGTRIFGTPSDTPSHRRQGSRISGRTGRFKGCLGCLGATLDLQIRPRMAGRRQSLPVSQTMTGVVLDLDPGGLHELHWHPNADEWQYITNREFSVSLFGAHGRYRIETLAKGARGVHPPGLWPFLARPGAW